MGCFPGGANVTDQAAERLRGCQHHAAGWEEHNFRRGFLRDIFF